MPSTDELRAKFDTLRGKYGLFQDHILEDRRYYDGDFADQVLPAGATARGFKAVIPRTARRIIDEICDHILYVPKVRIPIRPTESNIITEQEIAEKKRKAVAAWWRQVTQRFNPLGDLRKWGAIDGMMAIKQTCRLDLLPEKGAKDYKSQLKKLGQHEFLWDIEILNNEWVFPDPSDHRNPDYVYVAYSLLCEQAKKRFPKGQGDWRGKQDYDHVNYMEYWSKPTFNADGTWTPGRFIKWIDTEVVHDAKNPYPYIPIVIDDSGQGIIHEAIEPEKKFVGFLRHSLSIFVAQARQWSAMAAVTELTSFNPIITRNISDERLAQLKTGPGEIWSLEGTQGEADAEDISLVAWPPIPITVPQLIALTDRELNGALNMDMLGGIPQSGVDTASEADQNIRNASAKLSGLVAGMERMAVKMTRNMLMDIELVFEAPVTLFGAGANDPADITLTPREINGYYDCFVQLRTTDEEALDLTRARFWSELYRVVPFLSAFTAMEAGGISDDPLAEMIRRGGEDVYLSPEFTQIRVATGAQTFGEFATLLANMTREKRGGAPNPSSGGANSAEGLVQQTDINAPVQARIMDDAMANRDVNQGDSQMRAGGY